VSKITTTAILLIIVGQMVGCKPRPAKSTPQSPPTNTMSQKTADDGISGTVLETMNAGGYTYMLINTGSDQVWAAVRQQAMSIGEQVSISQVMGMPNFHSETLDRTFELIYFAQAVNSGGASQSKMTMQDMVGQGKEHTTPPVVDGVDFSGLNKKSGDLTIAEIYQDKHQLVGKSVVIKGKVVKFVAEVMGKNWIHIQDGSGTDGTNDLTVTTDAIYQAGDVVTVEGMITLDRDFGYGYLYDVIIEDGHVTGE